jgi:hypothetical protein
VAGISADVQQTLGSSDEQSQGARRTTIASRKERAFPARPMTPRADADAQ